MGAPSTDRPGSAVILAEDEESATLSLWLEDLARENPANSLLTVRSSDTGRTITATASEWASIARSIAKYLLKTE